MRTDNPWQLVSSEIKYENPWIKVHEDTVITPTGKDGIYGYMESNDSVMIAVLNDNRELYLVRTFRYPDKSWNWELPGGGGDRQDPLAASQRELEEETGIIAAAWEKLGVTSVCNGFMTEKMTTYLAHNLSFNGNKEIADELMDDARFFSLSEIDSMIKNGEINDGQSITTIHFAQKWMEQQV